MRSATAALPRLLESDDLAAAGETVRGHVRPTNQDAFLVLGPGVPGVDRSDCGFLFGVIDGIGGERGGEIASEIAKQTLLEYCADPAGTGPAQVEKLLYEANRRIIARTFRQLGLRRMGAVVSCLWTDCERVVLLHAGDTRVYGIADGGIVQLTEDQCDERA